MATTLAKSATSTLHEIPTSKSPASVVSEKNKRVSSSAVKINLVTLQNNFNSI